MKEKRFDENIERIYNALSSEQKEEYKSKQEKLSKGWLIFGTIFLSIVVAVLIYCFVICISEEAYALLAFVIFVFVLIIATVLWIISTSIMGIKGSDEIKSKMYIERLEKQKGLKKQQEEKRLQENVYYRLSVDNIKNVTILDSYTEMSDKLHAVLNYQEIIQTRVYKFKVDYKDGTSKVVTAPENSKEYTVLMPLVNKNTYTQTTPEKSNIEKIREYKLLLDDGIITQEEFEAKKKELL